MTTLSVKSSVCILKSLWQPLENLHKDIAKNTTDKKAKLKEKKVLIIQEGKKRETEEQTEKNKNSRPKSTY